MQKTTTFFNKVYSNKNFLFLLITIIVFFISKDYVMFWDNVLFASKMGNHLYENSIFNWKMPDSFDPGHPPFLGFLLAIFWKIFGHNLWAAHLLMTPFIYGSFVQLFKFISFYLKNRNYQLLAFFLVFVDPSLSTQYVLVNPEIIIVFFFFLALNGILYNRQVAKFIGFFFLSIITFRSMMLFAGLFVFDILNSLFIENRKIKKILSIRFIVFYFLASLPGLVYVAWRLLTKGWLQTHPDSPWASLWHFATPKIFLKNCLVLVREYLDVGRIFIFIFLIISILLYGKKIFKLKKNKQLFLISISSVIFVIIVSLIATNTFGHRYFIVSYITFIFLTFKIVIEFFKNRKTIILILFLGLVSGNLWIYPRHISQGWDATLAHVPYHSLRSKAIGYLNSKKINLESIASFFPNATKLDDVDLREDKRSFLDFTGKEEYVFYSTVYNLSDEEIKLLDNNYRILKEFNKFNINITIYILKDK
jgi:hypothetical protein